MRGLPASELQVLAGNPLGTATGRHDAENFHADVTRRYDDGHQVTQRPEAQVQHTEDSPAAFDARLQRSARRFMKNNSPSRRVRRHIVPCPGEIVPAQQRVLRDRALRPTPDDFVELPRRNASAGPLGPHVGGADGRARRDIADRHDAVEGHVPDILLAGLNLFRRAERFLDRANPAHQILRAPPAPSNLADPDRAASATR